MYNLNWKESRIKRQTKFHHSIHRFQNHNRSSRRRCSVKKVFLKTLRISTGKHLYWNLFLMTLQVWRLVFKNPYFEEHPWTTASVISKITVNPKNNGFTIAELHHRHFCWKSPRICEVILDGSFKVFATDKNMSSVGIKVTIASIDVIFR